MTPIEGRRAMPPKDRQSVENFWFRSRRTDAGVVVRSMLSLSSRGIALLSFAREKMSPDRLPSERAAQRRSAKRSANFRSFSIYPIDAHGLLDLCDRPKPTSEAVLPWIIQKGHVCQKDRPKDRPKTSNCRSNYFRMSIIKNRYFGQIAFYYDHQRNPRSDRARTP